MPIAMMLDSCNGSDVLREKVDYLSAPATYGPFIAEVQCIETHMSWVFLAGAHVLKLKKPVRYPFLDFSTLQARYRDCQAEVRLNSRLAPTIYRGVIPLWRTAENRLSLAEGETVVDWLVSMRRLPAERMLDKMLLTGSLTRAEVSKLAKRLAEFYAQAQRPVVSGSLYYGRLLAEQHVNREIITMKRFDLDHRGDEASLDRLDQLLAFSKELLVRRAETRALVDGHGDLRPEHICFVNGIAIFDCLEFSDELRMVDPVDELAYVGIEAALLGAMGLGAQLISAVSDLLEDRPPVILGHVHGARRAILRARLALAHLLDETPRDPTKWEPLARRYLGLAEAELDAAEAVRPIPFVPNGPSRHDI